MNPARFEPLESRQMMSITLGANLVINGDAETVPPPPAPVPAPPLAPPPKGVMGWRTIGEFEAARYGDPGMPTPLSPGPAARGSMLFGGGISETGPRTSDVTGASQIIDISSIAADVDAGRIKFDFSAYLGGFGFERDSIKAALVFDNGRVDPPAAASLDGPTPSKRRGVTGLEYRAISGNVTPGTRKILIQLVATKVYGKYIDGFADNIELKLSSSMPMNQGIVTGRVMNDANGNGKLDKGEVGTAGALVFSDRNLNGKPDAGEPSAQTDGTGAYIMQTAPGPNVIRHVPPAGYRSTGALARKVLVAGGLTTTGHSFLASQTGVITGNVFEDWNANAKRDKDDDPRAYINVFLDTNSNGKPDKGEPRAATDEKGNFSFVVPAGTYTVRQRESATRYRQTLPAKRQGIVVKLAPGAVSKRIAFGLQPIPE